MSDDRTDYQKIQEEVMDKLILAGWVKASVRRAGETKFLVNPEARVCIRKLRDFVAAFDTPGIKNAHTWMFFKIVSDGTFSDGDVLEQDA